MQHANLQHALLPARNLRQLRALPHGSYWKQQGELDSLLIYLRTLLPAAASTSTSTAASATAAQPLRPNRDSGLSGLQVGRSAPARPPLALPRRLSRLAPVARLTDARRTARRADGMRRCRCVGTAAAVCGPPQLIGRQDDDEDVGKKKKQIKQPVRIAAPATSAPGLRARKRKPAHICTAALA
jgi:hypothetical protein